MRTEEVFRKKAKNDSFTEKKGEKKRHRQCKAVEKGEKEVDSLKQK